MIEITDDAPAAAPASTLLADAVSEPAQATLPAGPLVIVGSGHAGYGLAEAVRARDAEHEIHVITADDGGLYSKPALSNAFALDKDVEALLDESALAIERRLNIRVHAYCPVSRIDAEAKRLVTRLGELDYGQLVLATGASPIRIPVEGASEALLSVNDRGDYAVMRERLETLGRKARIVIIGDGLIGCEFANDLAQAGHGVEVVGLAERPLPRLLPEAGSEVLRASLTGLGVGWHLERSAASVTAEADGYRLTLTDGEELEADLVISAVGLLPNIELAQAAGIDCGRGIRVDDRLATSLPDVFALGDAIEIDGQLLPYLAPINAGLRALAATLTGEPTAVSYPVMPVMVKTPAAPVCVVVPLGEVHWQVTETSDGIEAGAYDAGGRLQGFALVGEAAMARRSEWVKACGQSQAA
ncbi:FAD-dependent oxidoreductase [Larsenimonas salina]|uniref:FAD-dependent oxidoreductase n=1 Tax=Larsenimonas salina TaxID=1295565 RepID=UPI0020749006|nr:FAD-dependent oxidoreductase [Larsenimonas salina]MCM5705719.1 FAD-dependent oxidoreductase [Larsenimonas salina]